MQPKQICILTGATGGIGEAIAKALDSCGYQLILLGRNKVKLNALKGSLEPGHRYLIGDLTDSHIRQQLIEQCFSKPEQRATMLINNAGVSVFKSIEDVTHRDIERIITMNLSAVIDFTRLFLANVNEASTVVNVGSAFGAIGYPGYSLYCASKFGLRGFTEALSRELADTDHRVCYFAPRATKTSINSKNVELMNIALGNHSDSPEFVAKELLSLIDSKSIRKTVGWPEKFFARLNGVLPELVDHSIYKQAKQILTFARGQQS